MFLTSYNSKNQFLKSFRRFYDLEKLSNEEMCDYYDWLLKMRHDCLHFCLSLAFFGEWIPEKEISTIFVGYDSWGHDQTPDIVLVREKDIFLVDVSVTRDYYKVESEKTRKYQRLVDSLKIYTKKEVFFIPFILDLNNYNFCSEKEKINFILPGDVDESFFTEGLQIFDIKKDQLNSYVNRDFFRNHLRSKYFNSEEVGILSDTKIQPELLDKIFNKKYPHSLNLEINEEEIMNFSRYFLKDERLKKDFYDTENNSSQYEKAFQEIQSKQEKYEKKNQISFYNLFPIQEDILPVFEGDYCEQRMIYQLCHFVTGTELEEKDDPCFHFLYKIFKGIDSFDPFQKRKFESGIFIENEKDLKEEYRDKKLKGLSFQSYLQENKIIPTSSIRQERPKSMRFPLGEYSRKEREFYDDSNTGYYKEKFKHAKKKEKKTQNYDDHLDISFYKNFLMKDNMDLYGKTLEDMKTFLLKKSEEIVDHPQLKLLKKQSIFEISPFFCKFLERNYCKVLWFAHLFYSQLMHILSYSDKENQYTFFNCGSPNRICIVLGGYKSKDTQTPKAYMELIITREPEFYKESVFGKLYKKELRLGTWLVCTNWRRVTLDRCTFMRDSFYSVFSSSVSFFENIGLANELYFHEMTAIKSMVSLCPKQQVQELLMDSRYAIMSSFSIYTNIYELLTTKFEPPYYCALSCWIVHKLFNKLPKQTKKILTDPGCILSPVPEFEGDQIRNKTKGGKVNLHSIWTDFEVTNIEQILEETFIYVHTMKEPASLYHEKIKAVNTILKFQEEFDNAGDEKYGKVNNFEEMLKFTSTRFQDKKEKYIGYSSNVIYNSFKNLIEIIKPDFKKIINDVLEESIGEIVSTKAVIHDIGRNYKISDEDRKSVMKRIFKRMRKIEKISPEDTEFEKFYGKYKEEKDKKRFILENMSSYYHSKPRQKVWETILDVLEDNKSLRTVEEFLDLYLKKEEGEMEADICIKAQYGSKREFYVVNIGCKIYARIIEKFFYYLCCNCVSECISIPGDKKMISMQSMLDKASFYCGENNLSMVYVNGDCTKWSAAETMGSFLTMVEVLKEYLPLNFYKLLRTGFSLWADKKINIPIELIEKLIPNSDILKEKFEENKINLSKPQISSTQNFLQGMFNYASSLKASSCNYYMEKIWQTIYPETKLRVFHMEHSDDYVQIICFENKKELEDYRSLYKLFMKFHGYNDSARKTSCQSFFMEFVSLMSFNGQMLYPKIKKTKEINLSLPCTSYKDDCEAALSRSGECLRMGCSLSFSYFFQRLHNYCLAEAYSLLEGMSNHIPGRDIFNEPIEMYGIPDQYPLFSLYCKGNINNYRIFTFGNEEQKKNIKGLYYLGNKYQKMDLVERQKDGYENILYSPHFVYDQSSQIVKTFRKKLGLTYEYVLKFWEENPEYRFLKPRDPVKLSEWLKVKFYDRAFLEAYTKVSRTRMTMRISRFVNTKCTRFTLDEKFNLEENYKSEETFEFLTIRESYEKLKKEMVPTEMENSTKTLLRADATATTIYDYVEKMTIFHNCYMKNPNITIGCLTPHKPKWIYLENNPGILLQYFLNKKNFVLDQRKIKSDYSLARDMEKINKYWKLEDVKTPIQVQNLFNDLVINKDRRILHMGYDRKNETLHSSITDQLCFNLTKDSIYNVVSGSISMIKNPFNEKKYYVSTHVLAENTYQQCLETIALIYVILRRRYDYTVEEIKNFLSCLNFKTKGEGKELENTNWREILNIFHPDFFENIPTHIDLKKQAAFLRYVLLSESNTVKSLVDDIYSYAYRYEKMGVYKDNKYTGETICSFVYLNKNFRFKQQDNNIPRMYTNTKEKSINKSAWWVCLRLANIISESQFKYNLYNYDPNTYTEKIKRKKDFKCYLAFSDNKLFWEYTKTGLGLPIFYIEEKIRGAIYEHKLKNNMIPSCNNYTFDVHIGKHKLFKMPYWFCKQYNVIEKKSHVDEIYLEGIELNYFIEHKLFENILLEKTPRQVNWKEIPMCEETLQFALKYIVKCKGTYNLGNFKLISDIEKEKENLLKKFDERKEKKIKEREYDEAFEELIDKEREEKKKKEADMFDFSFIELMGYSDDEEKDFNDELNEETDFRDEYIMNDDEVTILEREEEENLPFVESGFFRNFSLCQPKREIAISKWSQIKGPLKNIYNYKPILFNVLDGISRNEIIPTNTCYSNVIYLLKKYEETTDKDYKLKTLLVYLFYRFFFKTLKNNFYYTDEQYHIRMIDYEFVFFKKGIFNMETKEKIIKLKGKDFYLERVLKEDNDICIMISKIENLPKGLFEQYINFSPYEEVMEHVSKELTKSKIETYEDLDFFD